jgi:dethiobiotin synthetase
MSPTRIVLVGTGTGIGKTHLGVALVHALDAAGVEVAGLKPVESGVGEGVTDADLLARSSRFPLPSPPPYRLAAPLSPHLAAPREGIVLQLPPILAWVASVRAAVRVVETAGALLSPLAPGLTNLDLTVALQPDALVLVAPDRLGVLHDVTATLFAMRQLAPGLPEAVVALMAPAEPDASTGTNGGELVGLGIARRVVTFPRAPSRDDEVQARAGALIELLGVPFLSDLLPRSRELLPPR